MSFWSPYPRTVWRAKDVLWNGIAGGERKQTWSDRIGDKLRAGRLWARILDRIFFGHFQATVERFFVDESSIGVLLFGIGLVAVGVIRWTWPEFFVRWIETPFYGGTLAWFLAQRVARLMGRHP